MFLRLKNVFFLLVRVDEKMLQSKLLTFFFPLKYVGEV